MSSQNQETQVVVYKNKLPVFALYGLNSFFSIYSIYSCRQNHKQKQNKRVTLKMRTIKKQKYTEKRLGEIMRKQFKNFRDDFALLSINFLLGTCLKFYRFVLIPGGLVSSPTPTTTAFGCLSRQVHKSLGWETVTSLVPGAPML